MSAVAPRSGTFRLTDGVVLGFAAELVLLPTGLITAAVLTRVLGARGYGLFSVAATFLTWVSFATMTFLTRATVKFVSETDAWRPVAISILRWRTLIGAAGCVVVLLGAPLIATWLGGRELTPYLRVFSIDVLLFNIARTYRDVLTGRGRFRAVAAISAARWSARLVLIVGVVLVTGSVMGAVIASVLTTGVELLMGRGFGAIGWRGPTVVPWSRLWQVSAPLLLYGVTMQLFSKIDLFMLSSLRGAGTDVGHYAAAQNLAVAPGLLALSLSPLLLATISRLRRDGAIAAADRIARGGLRLAIALLPFAALVAGLSDDIVRVIFGASFAAAAPLLALLFTGGAALVVLAVGVSVLTAVNAQRVVPLFGAGLLVSAVIGHQLMIPRYGAMGAAVVTGAVSAAGALATLPILQHRCGVTAYGTILRAILLAIPTYWGATHVAGGGLLALLLTGSLLSLGILGGFLLLGELDAQERRQLVAVWPWRGAGVGA